MKRRLILILMTAGLAGIVLHEVLLSAQSSSAGQIAVEVARSISAGQPLDIAVHIAGAEAGVTVEAALFNGLQRHSAALALGTGGVALWRIPPETLVHAGESLLVIRHAGEEVRLGLTVRPGEVERIDLLTTANNIGAYGEETADILVLPRDRWGGVPSSIAGAVGEIRYPDGEIRRLPFTYRAGLGWARLRSLGAPGRVRLRLGIHAASATLEINQLAGRVSRIDLQVSPACVLDDGRDLITLSARVTDRQGFAVVDGTLVMFTWRGGQGYGQTIDGQAALRLPTSARPGVYRYSAEAAGVESNTIELTVTADRCSDDD